MRIACFSYYYTPEYNAEGLVTAKWVQAMEGLGHYVAPFCGGVGFAKHIGLQDFLWLSVRRCVTLAYLKEVAGYVRPAIDRFLRTHSAEPFDCIVSRFEPTSSCAAGYLARELTELPWIVNINDPMPRICKVRRSLRAIKDLDL